MPKRRTAEVVLGGDTYTVHAFNIGELEDVGRIISDESLPNPSRSFAILRLAMKRAEPKVDDVDAIEPEGLDEVTKAAQTIMQLSGLTATGNPPQEPGAA